jgi:DNA-binding transcriptional regulator PaaX
VATADIARELGLDGNALREVVRRAADKGWLEIGDDEGSRFRLSEDLVKRLGILGEPFA